jgi:hypothetical protein
MIVWYHWNNPSDSREQRTWTVALGDRIVGFADTGVSCDEDVGPEMGEVCSIYHAPKWVPDSSVRQRVTGSLGEIP